MADRVSGRRHGRPGALIQGAGGGAHPVGRELWTGFECKGDGGCVITKGQAQDAPPKVRDRLRPESQGVEYCLPDPPLISRSSGRASGILSELREAERQKALQMNAEKNIPNFNPGDAIEVKVGVSRISFPT